MNPEPNRDPESFIERKLNICFRIPHSVFGEVVENYDSSCYYDGFEMWMEGKKFIFSEKLKMWV